MAEVLGVVASGIAVVDAAGQIGSGIFKLRRLWNEVSNVPDTIKTLMQRLELLAIIMREMETIHQSSIGDATIRPFNSQGMQMSMARCREARDTLEDLVTKLTQHVDSQKRSKRTKAKLRVALGREDLSQCHSRLNDAVQLLQVAQSCYQMSMHAAMLQQLMELPKQLESRPEPIIRAIEWTTVESRTKRENREIESSQTVKVNISEVDSVAFTGQKVSWMQSWEDLKRSLGPFASYAWHSSETKERGSGFVRKDFRFRFEMAQWLSGKSWEIQVARAMSGWHHHFKTYNVVPRNAEVIKCARRGDLERIKYLFANNLASIHDRDITGCSLLYHAVVSRKSLIHGNCHSAYELAKFLHTRGLDMTEDTQDSMSPLMICSSHPGWVSYLPWLTSCWQSSEAADSTDVADLTEVIGLSGSSLAFAAFQPLIQPNFYGMPLIERVRTWLLVDVSDARSFRKVVRKSGTIMRNDAVELAKWNINLLSVATRSFVRRRFVPWYNRSAWNELMHDLIFAIGDVNLQQEEHSRYDIEAFDDSTDCGNPLMVCILAAEHTFFRATYRSSKQSFERHLDTEVKEWLRILQDCNIDLEKYGQHEHSMMFRKSKRQRMLGSQKEAWAWTGFSWGPNPSDWVLHLDRVVERFSGDFWRLIDNPIQQVPGAWIDNDSDYLFLDVVDLYSDSSDSEPEDDWGGRLGR